MMDIDTAFYVAIAWTAFVCVFGYVTRLCTDGTKNACSMLYAASARVAEAAGYKRIQTYILETETGGSLKASGWADDGPAGGGQWNHSDGDAMLFGGPNRRTDQPTCGKRRWARPLNQWREKP